ncbi:putative rRNA methyltransferase [Mobilicoccus pelagius NBRC 104925]|uniref:Putative rRNA methyltransferase n=1 Tax=Mobilicoccus pelagius NBRC 104925 TaxID=1089455 RepID=H5UUZ9_9MICO|nr:putative rRNA methyltransferase [Mobilicoccus pelagius NBRC 104925]
MSHGGQARYSDPARRSAQRPSERRRQADPARRVAFASLRAISDGAYANLDLPGRLRDARLGARDAAFATELVYGVTRMRGFYDAVIARGAGRDVEKIDAPVLDALRLGAHQLLGMRVPAHAAVDATVGLVRSEIGAGPASFTNAVLRRVSERSAERWRDLLAPHADLPADDAGSERLDLEDVAVAHSHPAWIVRALRTALLAHGTSTPDTVDADLLAVLRADNHPADVALVARPGLVDPEELLEAGGRPGPYAPTAVVLDRGGDPGRFRAVREGRAAVQDEGSQLLVHALVRAYDDLTAGRVDDPAASPDGPRWLDLAAGPGGKAALLAALSIPRGAQLFCNEVSEHRAELVESTLGAAMDAGAEVFVGVGDGRGVGAEEPDSFDLVLLDAPCTGLGALRRRPDARWRRVPADVADLTALQEELLVSALGALRPGGVLAYATCSPHDAETLQVLRRVLATRDDVRLLDAPAYLDAAAVTPLPDLRPRIDAGDLAARTVQLWPHRHGTDAMFLALLARDR